MTKEEKKLMLGWVNEEVRKIKDNATHRTLGRWLEQSLFFIYEMGFVKGEQKSMLKKVIKEGTK